MIRWRRAAASLVAAVVAAVVVAVSMAACSSPAPQGWRRIGASPFAPTAGSGMVSLAAVVAGRPWLAVGTQVARSGQEQPRAWSSPDGRTWRPDRLLPTTLDGPSDRLIGVAQRGRTAIAAGEYASAKEGNFRPTMWWRDPAGTWHDVDAPRELFGGERAGGLVAVAASAAGFIAVGGWTDAGNQPDVGVWRSVDARVWSRVDGEAALSPMRGEVVVATAATGVEHGFVVVGNALSASASRGVAWSSPDGLQWSRSAVDGAAVLQAVTATPDGALAVGLDQTGMAAAWRSADGRDWAPAGRLPSGGAATLTSATGAGGDVLAAGVVADRRPGLWRYAPDRWMQLVLPSGLTGVTRLIVAGAGSTTVLAADRPSGAALWLSRS